MKQYSLSICLPMDMRYEHPPIWLSLGTAVLLIVTLVASAKEGQSLNGSAPNIIVIMTDQQSSTMMSCTGNKWVKTPSLDALAAGGMRFERAYVANPVCVPARFSIQTGYLPVIMEIWMPHTSVSTKALCMKNQSVFHLL